MRTLPSCALRLFTAVSAAFRDSRCFVQNIAKTTADRSASWLFFSFAEPSAGHDVCGNACRWLIIRCKKQQKQPAAPCVVGPPSLALYVLWLSLNPSGWSNVHSSYFRRLYGTAG